MFLKYLQHLINLHVFSGHFLTLPPLWRPLLSLLLPWSSLPSASTLLSSFHPFSSTLLNITPSHELCDLPLHLGQSSCSVRSSGCLVKMLFPGILVRSQIFTAQLGSVSILGNSAMERLTAGITVTRMSTGGSFRNPGN